MPQAVDCQVFLSAQGTNVEHIVSKRSMRTGIVPQLEDLLDERPIEIYPYTETFEEAHMDPCLASHTTGSTGLPKPITWKVGILSTYEAWRTIPSVDGYVPTTEIYQLSKRAYTSMPLFHTSGHDQDSDLAVWLNGRRLIRCLGLSMPCFVYETVSEAEPKRGSRAWPATVSDRVLEIEVDPCLLSNKRFFGQPLSMNP